MQKIPRTDRSPGTLSRAPRMSRGFLIGLILVMLVMAVLRVVALRSDGTDPAPTPTSPTVTQTG